MSSPQLIALNAAVAGTQACGRRGRTAEAALAAQERESGRPLLIQGVGWAPRADALLPDLLETTTSGPPQNCRGKHAVPARKLSG